MMADASLRTWQRDYLLLLPPYGEICEAIAIFGFRHLIRRAKLNILVWRSKVKTRRRQFFASENGKGGGLRVKRFHKVS
ncbi:unnamed protein product [Victoria cruziana]